MKVNAGVMNSHLTSNNKETKINCLMGQEKKCLICKILKGGKF